MLDDEATFVIDDGSRDPQPDGPRLTRGTGEDGSGRGESAQQLRISANELRFARIGFPAENSSAEAPWVPRQPSPAQ